MKKLLFTAMACTAFAFNGLASNEVIKNDQAHDVTKHNIITTEIIITSESDKKPCKFRIVGSDRYGRAFDTTWVTVGNVTNEDCDAAKNKKVKELKEDKATIDKIDSTWGN